ncbi:MAG: copper resistance protein D [halophilic archaeon J07HB67]|jgi:Copper resistance protein D.|nr:MAG: copper resistance protein D [halophilic archaeon J07HB67]
MSLATTVAYALHSVFAGAWTGAVVFTTWRLLPLAADSELSPTVLERVGSGLSAFARTSAVVMPVTGLWMAWTQYNQLDGLLVPPRGHTVLTMVVLWVAMTGLTEVGASRIRDAADQGKVRTAAVDAGTVLKTASVVGVVLLLLGGYLSGPGV